MSQYSITYRLTADTCEKFKVRHINSLILNKQLLSNWVNPPQQYDFNISHLAASHQLTEGREEQHEIIFATKEKAQNITTGGTMFQC